MGLPTVHEVWRLALPTATQLLSGKVGLVKPVRWARRMAVTPPAFAALDEGEIALLSVEALSHLDERLTLARVVEALGERGAAALAVVGAVPEEAKTAAKTCGLPLFLLPTGSDTRDIERDIVRLIVEREAQLERLGRQIYRQLLQLSIENQGLPTIAQALLGITGKPVVIQDENLSIQASAWPEDCPLSPKEAAPALEDPEPVHRWLWGQPLDGKAPPYTELSLAPSGFTRSVAAIVIEGNLSGYLSLLGGAPDDLDRLAVERGALVCAVEMAKRRAVEAAEDRLHGDFLDLLLTAGPAEQRALARRAAEMGYELERQHAVVIFGLSGGSSQTMTLMAGEFRAHLLNTGAQVFLCPHEGDLAALCGAKDAAHLRQLEELAQATRDRLVQLSPQVHIAVGIGRPGTGLAGLRRSFGQALEALTLARNLFDGNRVLPFSDLGVYRLLCRLQDIEELAQFYDQTLGLLAQYDLAHNMELIPTLEAFFAHHGNVSQTAEALYLHRNSLLYRLERIREITGLDLDDADDRFSLQLALKIRPILARI